MTNFTYNKNAEFLNIIYKVVIVCYNFIVGEYI